MKMLCLGQRDKANTGRHNPFVDCERISAIIKLLKDDLENNPLAYFDSQTEANSDAGQRLLKLTADAVQVSAYKIIRLLVIRSATTHDQEVSFVGTRSDTPKLAV